MPLFFYPDSNHILYPYKYILPGLDLDKQEGLISQCDGVRNYRIVAILEKNLNYLNRVIFIWIELYLSEQKILNIESKYQFTNRS